MKDNVKLHLDLLQTQLARLEGDAEAQPKFSKTVPLLDRLAKKGSSITADELRAQINETNRDIVSRKTHYAHTVLKRHLKQFSKVEPLRIAKRAKNTTDASKRAVLDEELKVLHALDMDTVCREILNRAITRRFPVLDLVPNFTRRALSPAESNVYARFGKIEVVRAAIKQLSESIIEVYPQTASDADTVNTSTSDAVPTEPKSSKQNNGDDFHAFESEDASEDAADEEEDHKDNEVDPFFEQPVGLADSDDSDDDDGKTASTNYGPTDDQGLPMLTQGYISGSEDDDFDEPVEQLRPERKNRRGQRARRKIWEQKFGQRANHIQKQEQEQKRKLEEKELRHRRKEQRENMAKRRRVELDSKPLHPSWEAKRKQLEAQKEVKFHGTKKKFD